MKDLNDIPEEYTTNSEQPGEVVRFEYDVEDERKYACIYLPYGYDEKKSYDVLYLMHGGGGRPEDYFGSKDHITRFKKTVDHLIEKGEMKPLIIVTPTVYKKKHDRKDKLDSWEAVKEFMAEIDKYLMPAVESVYSTYAETADEKGFEKSRDHRAFGGFSMGSVTTWYMLLYKMKFFSRFIPMSGDCWIIERKGGRNRPQETAEAMVAAVKGQGFSAKDFKVLAATGSQDRAAEGLRIMFGALKDYPEVFDFSEDGNISLSVKEGGQHEMKYVKQYLYNLLPMIF